ncbi:MAG: histidine--tRNA ligase [Patescibacteria group bacterium]|nr:histidine--tRNA ligase [Patescibacteria group bacterium]
MKKKTAKTAASPSFQTPKGMKDVLPEDWPALERVASVARSVAEYYNFLRIDTPIMEQADLFSRGVGLGTDIVEKEMYTLATKGGDKLALRPEYTAPMMRSYIQHGMSHLPQPRRLWYTGPVFRHENPQLMRYRQFSQFGLEVLGSADPVFDAEVIIAFYRLLEELKIKGVSIEVNSIGCKNCQPAYKRKLADYYRKQNVCEDCKARIETNPLRLFDCKNPECQPLKQSAPVILDNLCSSCRSHFRQVLEYLDEVKIPYVLNPRLVRGLDYYNRTVFETFVEGETAALASGGRYDYLAEMIGGRSTPAVGGAAGIERIAEVMKAKGVVPASKTKGKVFLIHVGEMSKKKSLSLAEEFHRAGVPVVNELSKESLSSQMELAAKNNSPLVLIFGQKESYEDSIIIRDMESGVQEVVPLSKVVEEVKKRLR